MKPTNWRETAELIGIAAIVASLIFVGVELRQGQRGAQIESGMIRAGWFFANRDAINDHADIWVKGNSGAQLTEAEAVIYGNLIRNIHTNNRFTWSRERLMGSTFDYPAHELAWILAKSPTAISTWEAYMSDVEEMRESLIDGYGSSEFAEIVRDDLEKLKAKRQ